MYLTMSNEKQAMILKENKNGHMGGFSWRKWKGEIMRIYFHVKIKERKKSENNLHSLFFSKLIFFFKIKEDGL